MLVDTQLKTKFILENAAQERLYIVYVRKLA